MSDTLFKTLFVFLLIIATIGMVITTIMTFDNPKTSVRIDGGSVYIKALSYSYTLKILEIQSLMILPWLPSGMRTNGYSTLKKILALFTSPISDIIMFSLMKSQIL